jgi:GT2 family glycosyltransferase/glycosyltransferase involved in cell wall biosynthesis
VSGVDVVKALEIALTGQTDAPENVELSVCILNFNKPVHSILSAIAVAQNAPAHTEILLLDNGSSPKDYELMTRYTRRYKNIRVTRCPRNLYFGEGNNVLLDQALGQRILFLNNDAYVGPTTLQTMMDHLDQFRETAAVGVTFLFPNLEVQEAGGFVSDCGQQIQLHKHSSFEQQRKFEGLKIPQQTQYISSACFCVRREILDELGGYDAIYEPLYFEDSDLCKRISSAGYRIDYLPWDYVIHFENASTREFLGSNFEAQITRNRATFAKRWLYQGPGYRPRNKIKALGRTLDPQRGNAIIYTPYNIGIGGGERYILSVAAALSETYNVIIVTPDIVSTTRISFALSDLSIGITQNMIMTVGVWEDMLGMPNIELMITMGNELVPPVPLIGKINIHHCQFPFPGHHEDRWQARRLRNLHAYFVNSDYTKRHVEAQLTQHGVQCPVHVTYAPVNIRDNVQPKAQRTSTLNLVSIGRFDPDGHPKRQDVILDIFKRLWERGEDVQLTLIGGHHSSERRNKYLDQLQTSVKGMPVKFLVNATRAALEEALVQGDIYIHACGFDEHLGAAPERQEHFGISVVEGIAFGLIPIVYDGGGPAEILQKMGGGYRYRTIEEAVQAVLRVGRLDSTEREEIIQRCQDFAKTFSDERFRERIVTLVQQAIENGAELLNE